MSFYTLLAVYCITGLVISEPAPEISSLRILGCSCSTCDVEQIGCAHFGSFILAEATFNGARVRCSDQPIVGFGRIVIGYKLSCDLPSTSGKFEVSYSGLGNKLCGISYDRVSLSSCSFVGVPCSSFG